MNINSVYSVFKSTKYVFFKIPVYMGYINISIYILTPLIYLYQYTKIGTTKYNQSV